MKDQWQPLNYADFNNLTPEQIAESCELAAEVLEGKWVNGYWFSASPTPDGEEEKVYMCMEGGLIAALWGVPEEDVNTDGEPGRLHSLMGCPVYKAVLDTIKEEAEEEDGYEWQDLDRISTWNDTGERTEQQVLDILHRTAKRVLGVEG